MFTTSPVTSDWRSVGSPVTAWPVVIPVLIARRTPSSRSSRSLSASIESRRSTAARTALSASSSCASGIPKTAITASPMNFSTVPPCSSSACSASSNHSDWTRRSDSGSSCSPIGVEPTQSQKSTVTVFLTSTGRVYGARTPNPAPPSTLGHVFDALANRLQDALGDLGRRSRLDEETVTRATREIRLALLEADVDFEVVKQFVSSVRERALGQEVLKGLEPGQQVVKIVHEELTELMGSADSSSRSAAPRRSCSFAAYRAPGRRPPPRSSPSTSASTRASRRVSWPRISSGPPRSTSSSSSAGSFRCPSTERTPPTRSPPPGRDLERATAEGCDVVIVDTAGRLQIDEELMDELSHVRDAVKPLNVLLVLDAMTGQEAVAVARAFQERIAFDGVVLTKLDGDARGGAALSVKAITGRPVKFASVGEKLDQLEVFHPDRMASRILGMGDVLTLIEKAEQAVERDEQEEMERRLLQGQFTFDDFLASTRMLKKMGPLQGAMKLVPGMSRQLEGLDVDERQMARIEAIVLSMMPQERRLPHVINGPRRRRIAAGSGTTIEDVNRLLQARKQMEKVMKAMGKGKLPPLPPELAWRRRRPHPLAPPPWSAVGPGRRFSGTMGRRHTTKGSEGMAVRMRLTRGRVEEEPDLPRRGGQARALADWPLLMRSSGGA